MGYIIVLSIWVIVVLFFATQYLYKRRKLDHARARHKFKKKIGKTIKTLLTDKVYLEEDPMTINTKGMVTGFNPYTAHAIFSWCQRFRIGNYTLKVLTAFDEESLVDEFHQVSRKPLSGPGCPSAKVEIDGRYIVSLSMNGVDSIGKPRKWDIPFFEESQGNSFSIDATQIRVGNESLLEECIEIFLKKQSELDVLESAFILPQITEAVKDKMIENLGVAKDVVSGLKRKKEAKAHLDGLEFAIGKTLAKIEALYLR